MLISMLLACDPHLNVLVVDDASPDGTGQIAEAISRRSRRVMVKHRPAKLGLGTAYREGFAFALEKAFDPVAEMDADFSHHPSYIPLMLRSSRDFDVVIGSRYVAGGGITNWSYIRRWVSRMGNWFARTVADLPLQDITAGFVVYRAEALKRLDLGSIGSDGYAFQIEMKYHLWMKGCSFIEIPILFSDREEGSSKMSGAIVREAFWTVWKLRLKGIKVVSRHSAAYSDGIARMRRHPYAAKRKRR